MAVYDGFFDATLNEETGEYDRAYTSSDFTNYFAQIIGTGVCVYDNPDSFLVRLEDGKAVVSPGYLFIQGYWLKNDADYTINLPGAGNYAIVAHLNLGARMIELEARSVAQAYPDSLVLAIVSPASAEDTRYNTDICGVISAAGDLSTKVEWAMNYIDSEIESKLAQVEQDINAQAARLDAKIAEVQAVADSIVPPPIGSIKFSASQDVGEEWLRCDGSFINEKDYPELVAALGKLTPSGDKFKLISDGEIGPQITNGALYGGRLWVYSYATRKLYGVDVEGDSQIKEIDITSEDALFSGFIAPSTTKPLALSIVPHKGGQGAEIFLAQIIAAGDYVAEKDPWNQYFLIFGAEFAGGEAELSLKAPFSAIYGYEGADYSKNNYVTFSNANCVPYVISNMESGKEVYHCMVGSKISGYGAGYISWSKGDSEASIGGIATGSLMRATSERTAYTAKNNGEAISVTWNGSEPYEVSSVQNGLFSFSSNTNVNSDFFRSSPEPINIAGAQKVLCSFGKNKITWFSHTESQCKSVETVDLPSAARVFVDAAAYLWGKDIYLIFVGTGIVFSRTLEEGSFGYLDTTSILGTITQFGYLDYSQDEGTLYLLGQDTTNKVKAAKIVFNTLYDYANDGAWLPMIASDGVPAYIKAFEGEPEVDAGPSVPVQVTIENGYSEYVSVLFNGEKLIPGTYTRMASESGKFSVGIRIDNPFNGRKSYWLKLNGANAVSISETSGVGAAATERFYTQDYISGGISLAVSS